MTPLEQAREALAEYVVLGAGKCTISKAHVAKGRAALSALSSAPQDEWQDIATAPGDGSDFLIATRFYLGGVVQVSWPANHHAPVDMADDFYGDATAWRPLPPPPPQG